MINAFIIIWAIFVTMPSVLDSQEDDWYTNKNRMTFLSNDDFALAQVLQFDDDDVKGSPRDDPEAQLQYFEGDMMIQEVDEAKVAMYSAKRWPHGRIPYIMENKFSKEERAAIARGVQVLQEKSCIRFEPKNDKDIDYVWIRRGPGCAAHVGRIGGQQWVFLGHGCYRYETVVHELMHAVGFIHEQSRPDRDAHVNIFWENIRPASRRNFRKHKTDFLADHGFPYDLMSVMHYREFAFSKNKKPTILPLRRVPHLRCRGSDCPSDLDIKKINYLYKCREGKSGFLGARDPDNYIYIDPNMLQFNKLFSKYFEAFDAPYDGNEEEETDLCVGRQCPPQENIDPALYPIPPYEPQEEEASQIFNVRPNRNNFWLENSDHHQPTVTAIW